MTISILDCIRCQNPLTLRETKEKHHHCAPCRKIVESAEHQEILSKQLDRANRRFP